MWFLHPPKSRRRWHVFTWLAAVPALGFVALVQVAGVESSHRELLEIRPYEFSANDPRPDYAPEYEHGWPFTWLRRGVGYREVEVFNNGAVIYRDLRDGTLIKTPERYAKNLTWTARRAWPLSSHSYRFSTLGFLFNLSVATCVVALTMAAAEVWLRRRGGFWRFKIIDFLAVVLLIGCGFGFYKWDKAQLQSQRNLVARISESDDGFIEVSEGYAGPEWLARLFGNPELVPVLQRMTDIGVYKCDPAEAKLDRFAPLKHINNVTLRLHHSANVGIIAELERFKRVRHVTIEVNTHYHFLHYNVNEYLGALQTFPRLDTISLYSVPLAEDLGNLRHLPRLRHVTLSSLLITKEELLELKEAMPEVWFEDLEDRNIRYKTEIIALARMNRLHGGHSVLGAAEPSLFWFGPPTFNATNLQPLSNALPKLRGLEIRNTTIDPVDLPEFKHFLKLKAVILDTPDLPVEFMQQLAELPNLEEVTVRQRPTAIEPLLALRSHPPQRLTIMRKASYTKDEIQSLTEAFGDRLQLR